MTTETAPSTSTETPVQATTPAPSAATGTPATPTAGATSGILDAKVEGTTGDAKSGAPATPATDGASPDTKPAATGDAPKGDASATAYELKLPEGFQANDAILTEFKAVANESGLKPEAAQKFIDLQAKLETARVAQVNAQWEQQQAQWAEACAADKEIGGANLEQTKALVQKALDLAGGDALRAEFRKHGLQNHPVFVKAFAAIGKALAEDTIAGTAGASPTPGNNDDAFLRVTYPTMFPKS